jgi:hypothetical protein
MNEVEKSMGESQAEIIQRPEAQPIGETRELDEAALKTLAEQAGSQVEIKEKQTLDNAERRVASPPSLGIEQAKANDVFERGGFAERIQAIKTKIAELAKTTKEKITALAGGGPEVIHFNDLANEMKQAEMKASKAAEAMKSPEIKIAESPTAEAKSETVSPIENPESIAGVATEKMGAKQETTEQKEKRELKEYLEKEVFAKFGLTPEAEAKAIAEAPENRREILARSFENTKKSLQVFYEQEVVEGTLDRTKAQHDLFLKRSEATIPAVQEELSKRGFADVDLGLFGLTEATRDKTASTTPDYAVKEFFDGEKMKVEREVQSRISKILMNEGQYRDITYDRENPKEMDDETYEKFKKYVAEETEQTLEQKGLSPAAIAEAYSKIEKIWYGVNEMDVPLEFRRKTPEEVTESLQAEKELADKTNFLCINIGAGKLETVIQQGGFRDIFNLTEEELAEMRRIESRGDAFYFNQRKTTEEALGVYDPDVPTVYGTYASENGIDEKTGGADTYGSIFLKLKPEAQAVFCEGDSMSGSNWIGDQKVRQLGIDRLNYAEYARGRQIAPEHAALVKGMNNLFMKIENSYGNSVSSFGYLEAHIKGVKVEDIASINIPENIASGEQIAQDWGNYKAFVERLQADPQWKDKINIIKN